MAATTAGYDWPRPSPLQHSSPDQASPIYPDRPIRPLPKRRLRARLSPQQAESIIFPPAPPTATPLFTFPYSQLDKTPSLASRSGRGEFDHPCNCGQDHSDPESDEDDEAGVPFSISRRHNRKYIGGRPNGEIVAAAKSSKPASTSSSADDYESFENTNNKKKRKIPNMAGSVGHHTSLLADMASMDISRDRPLPDDGDGGVGQYYGSGSAAISAPSGTGISGAGRGRYGRSSGRTSSERRTPLGASTSAMNAFVTGHSNRARRDFSGKSPNKVVQPEQAGIISTAIAHAQAQPPQNGDENVSLLQQEASKTTPQKTQFTFTCGSNLTSKMVWPGQTDTYATPLPPDSGKENNWPPSFGGVGGADGRGRVNTKPLTRHPVATQATQTSPKINGAQGTAASIPANAPQSAQPNANAGQAPQPPKKSRRRPSREYAIAARQRRLQQEYANWHNRPSREEIWICEFCEYEDLFGEPPHALVRQYEIKDRKERKRLEEKRRLLEKARMKGRKGKKGSKNSKNNAGGNSHSQQAQQAQAQGGHQRYDPPLDGANDFDPNGEEYYEDEYDDGYDDLPDLEPEETTPVKTEPIQNGPWKAVDEVPKGTKAAKKSGKSGGA